MEDGAGAHRERWGEECVRVGIARNVCREQLGASVLVEAHCESGERHCERDERRDRDYFADDVVAGLVAGPRSVTA